MTRLLLATRNNGKLEELRRILSSEITVLGLADVPEFPELPETGATFEENALAKARYFAAMTGELALADDSGLCVDALAGAPGVRSRRFAAVDEARGERQDAANNRHLLALLADVPDDRRTAHYVCSAAAAWLDGRETVHTGTCDGVILREPRGTGGFGYDPLFYVADEGQTFGELPPDRKNALSHRGKAVRALLQALAES